MRGVGPILVCALLLAAPAAQALPTPGFFGEEARTATGRLFPGAMQTNDFVSLQEALDGLKTLEEENPDLLTFHKIGKSLGWENAAGGHDRFPVFAVTVTNEKSPIPSDEKMNLLFQLSIHANEKGGREGGVRVIEDFVLQKNGDLPVTQGVEPGRDLITDEHVEMLDYMRLIFTFPNPDGWVHEELEYRQDGDAAFWYMRGNGNGTDLNRQAPTTGWSRGEGDHAALSEPETRNYIPWLENNFTKIHFASDIHGMTYPANALIDSSAEVQCVNPPNIAGGGEVCLREGDFILTMLPAGQFTPKEHSLMTMLSEKLEQRLDSDPYYAEWNNAPEGGVWGGSYNGWGTVWDTIGYVDSGFHSDWFAQDNGLDAPGVDFEYAYNHITFDNYYPGLAQRINAYHIQSTRTIVQTFMDIASTQVDVRLDGQGTTTAYVPTEVSVSDEGKNLTRWAAENPYDDPWDWAHGGSYNETINQYFEDQDVWMMDGTGEVTPLAPDELSEELDGYDNLVIPGSAVDRLHNNSAAADAIQTYVENGGNLLLTDQALELLETFGIVEKDTVDVKNIYAGHTNWVDREHALADGVRGLARQLFEPMPLGFQEGDNSPGWFVNRSSFEDAGGETVGTFASSETNVGTVTHGEGTIALIGSILPDPTDQYYHPYGLDSYAVTYTGQQLMQNTLGWEKTVDTEPRASDDGNVTLPEDETEPSADQDAGAEDTSETPFPALLSVLAALGAALVLVRRRGQP